MRGEWQGDKRYNNFSSLFKAKFNGRVQKVSIDAGFSCPNRDGAKGVGGCSYCNNRTFKPSYTNLEISVTEQIDKGVTFFRKRYNAISFTAYFQAYSNTYAPVDELKRLYDEALSHPEVIGLVIATRPDCLTTEILDLLEEYATKYYVMIELGVESVNNSTLDRINRGHSYEESAAAITECAARGIHTCAHLILGLPGESKAEALEQAETISKLPVENIKLHQLQIHKGTALEKEYLDNPEEFNLFSVEEYLDVIIEYLERLKPSIVVERFVSTAPPDLLIAPKWGLKNFEFVDKLDKKMELLDSWQGKRYNP